MQVSILDSIWYSYVHSRMQMGLATFCGLEVPRYQKDDAIPRLSAGTASVWKQECETLMQRGHVLLQYASGPDRGFLHPFLRVHAPAGARPIVFAMQSLSQILREAMRTAMPGAGGGPTASCGQ